ncbi:MAG: hypothetical protein K0Q51_514 [Rickettsiaceae bacterium]|jgi:uncharacterized membrane protein|nr:hypothetical protein [Rickettsiaceae bacterium]
MKETKKFFDTDNRLNKGYSESNPKESDSSFYRKRFENIFPPVDIIEAYENLYEGATEKLIALAEQEQFHRQNMEKATLAVYERSKRLGAFLALFTVLIIGYVTLEIFKLDKNFEAILFSVTAFAAIFGVSCFYYLKNNRNKGERRVQAHQAQSAALAHSFKGKRSFGNSKSSGHSNVSSNYSNSSTRRRRYN